MLKRPAKGGQNTREHPPPTSITSLLLMSKPKSLPPLPIQGSDAVLLPIPHSPTPSILTLDCKIEVSSPRRNPFELSPDLPPLPQARKPCILNRDDDIITWRCWQAPKGPIQSNAIVQIRDFGVGWVTKVIGVSRDRRQVVIEVENFSTELCLGMTWLGTQTGPSEKMKILIDSEDPMTILGLDAWWRWVMCAIWGMSYYPEETDEEVPLTVLRVCA